MQFNESQLAEFSQKGFVIVKSLLSPVEIGEIRNEINRNESVNVRKMESADSTGNTARLSLWFEAGDNIYGKISRSRKIVDRAESLLKGEVYHWHSKVIMKEARTGGAWEWHQDYGYWYKDNCLAPDLISCMIAIDPCTKENGCLQVLVGSHQLGRIDHDFQGKQMGADLKRVAEAEKIYEKFHVELKPGDAIFFHCNLLHTSAPNFSDQSRYVYIACYNKKTNSPFGRENKSGGHPVYSPIVKVEDSEILGVPV